MSSLSADPSEPQNTGRPNEPPPYPGRSVIINYDYDDPEHWKNKLDKLQILAELRQSMLNGGTVQRSPAVSLDRNSSITVAGMTPAKTLSSPVAAGAALTLAELKRKQMCKRRARLLAVGSADKTSQNAEDDYEAFSEEDVDSAEASLELRLRRLLAKETEANEYDVDVHTTGQAVPITPAPDTPRDTDSLCMDSLSPTDEPQSHGHATFPSPRRTLSLNYSKYHVYNSKIPTIPLRKTPTNRRVLTETEFKESFENSREIQFSESENLKATSKGASRHSVASSSGHFGDCFTRNAERSPEKHKGGRAEKGQEYFEHDEDLDFAYHSYTTLNSGCPRGTPICNSEFYSTSGPVSWRHATEFRESSTGGLALPANVKRSYAGSGNYSIVSSTPSYPPFSPENGHSETSQSPGADINAWEQNDTNADRNVGELEEDVESLGGARRVSSDEGFGGNVKDEEEILSQKKVLALCDMQLQLLKAMAAGREKTRKENYGTEQRGTLRRGEKHELQEYESNREAEMARRCELLEDHIATLTKNIEHLNEEIQYQQASLRHLEHSQRPRVRFADDTANQAAKRMSVAQLPETDSSDESPATSPKPRSVPVRAAAPPNESSVMDGVTFSNPQRITKLTRFFGAEPPLIKLFLKKLGYEEYTKLFDLEKIGLNELPYMTEDRLRRLGIPMGPRTRILREAQTVMKLDRNPNIYLV